jgi:DNA mismatch repair protein MutL
MTEHRRPTTDDRIRLLPDSLVNQIAAGEVIERPAAAVKELVENALDAGATRISVSLAGGGIERIDITDDGHGMDAADLALAVQRHCTSKLPQGDLVHIGTLGFRGEALPSIGAAARLTLTSRKRDSPNAHRIAVAGGQVGAVAPAAGPPGTRALVEDLFYATPARRKFLRNPRTEADHGEQALRRLAFAAPGCAFRLDLDGARQFDLPQQSRAERVAALLGPDAAASLLAFEAERNGCRLSGFAAAPSVTRASAAGQSLVVNGRPVTDPVLRIAVRVAYRDVIAAGRYPVVALWLEVPPDELDVNVHPAKSELRFRHADAIRALVIGTLQRTLSGGAGPATAQPWQKTARPGRSLLPPLPGSPRYTGFAEAQLPLGGAPSARGAMAAPAYADATATPLPDAASHPLGAPLAQVLDTYIIAAAADESLILVDQHAAHERLTHELLRRQLLDGGVSSQPLLLPAVVDLPGADAARLIDASPHLAGLGLELESFGPGAVLVRALPAALGAADPAPLVRDIADELADGASTALEARLDAVIARMACHGSIRAGRRLSLAEMDALLRQMEATPRAATCSHGRPTFLKLSRAEIERLFGR